MARFAAGVLAGVIIATVAGAAAGLHADERSRDITEVAEAAGYDPQELAGAVNKLNYDGVAVDVYTYARSEGRLAPLPAPPASSARVECIIRVESRGDPNARNRSGASGLGQFLPSTWATTPQGQAGLSVFNASANRAAIAWMLSVGRAREFDAVRFYGC